jgi:hypothetical protein
MTSITLCHCTHKLHRKNDQHTPLISVPINFLLKLPGSNDSTISIICGQWVQITDHSKLLHFQFKDTKRLLQIHSFGMWGTKTGKCPSKTAVSFRLMLSCNDDKPFCWPVPKLCQTLLTYTTALVSSLWN